MQYLRKRILIAIFVAIGSLINNLNDASYVGKNILSIIVEKRLLKIMRKFEINFFLLFIRFIKY